MPTTTNLSDFGYRELGMLRDLIQAKMDQGLPASFDLSGVTAMMNQNSGNVFFTNDEFEVAMLNGDKLELFVTCRECGDEDFASELSLNDNGECPKHDEDSSNDEPGDQNEP